MRDVVLDWSPIDETTPTDGRLVLLASANGAITIAPLDDFTPPPLPREVRVNLAKEGVWPNTGWRPTHWMPLPLHPNQIVGKLADATPKPPQETGL